MLQRKYSLTEKLYKSFKEFEADKILMADLFVNVLGIAPTCTWQDLIDELRFWKSKTGQSDFDFDSISELYECLSNVNHGSKDEKELRFVTYVISALSALIRSQEHICERGAYLRCRRVVQNLSLPVVQRNEYWRNACRQYPLRRFEALLCQQAWRSNADGGNGIQEVTRGYDKPCYR